MQHLRLFLLAAATLGLAACVASEPEQRTGALRGSPEITSISPTKPKAGDVITIRGSGFGDGHGSSWVRVAAQPWNDRPIVTRWTDTEIIAVLDGHLDGPAEISVVAKGRPSRAMALPLKILCSPPPEFALLLKLGKVVSSEAFDVITTIDCKLAVVGAVNRGGGNEAFFALTNEFGAVLPGFPRIFPKIASWRSVAKTITGYNVAGTSADADVVLAELDEDGNPLEGWPVAVRTEEQEEVAAAAHSMSQTAVVGAREERAFFTLFDLDGNVVADRVFDNTLLGSHRARGVSTVIGGFVVVGDRTVVQPGGGKINQGWVARINGAGEILEATFDSQSGALNAAASTEGEEIVAVGSRGGGGHTGYFELSDLYSPLHYEMAPPNVELNAVESLERAFVAAGASKDNAMLVQTNCVGAQIGSMQVDLGGIERFEGLDAVFAGPMSNREIAYVAVGSRLYKGTTLAMIARRDAFPLDPIVSFKVNDGPDAALNWSGEATLSFTVSGALRYEINKVQGPGPEPTHSGGVINGVPTAGSQTLVFNTDELAQCVNNDGCAGTTYELIAHAEGNGRCQNGRRTRATVTVVIDLDDKTKQLVLSAATVVEKYGTFANAWPPLLPSHVDVLTPVGPLNRCMAGMGVPYGTVDAIVANAIAPPPGSAALIDDRKPGLVSYTSDHEGRPTTLIMAGFGTWFTSAQPTLIGNDYIDPEKWEGHFGGWHTGEGGMAIVLPDEPGAPAISDWRTPSLVPPSSCGSRNSFCGAALPWVWHPALWDVHIFFPPDGSLPLIAFMSMDAGLDDPCAALDTSSPEPALMGCDSGTPSLERNPFFRIDSSGAPVTRGCM